MCGRFALFAGINEVKKYADFIRGSCEWQPHYNISPGMTVPLIINEDGQGIISSTKWGFRPFFAEKSSSSYNIINARAETIAAKKTFKSAFESARCLIPANGFYEWRSSDKRPFYITSKDNSLLFFAGLLSRQKRDEENPEKKDTFAVITTEADDSIRPVHHRMPAMIPVDFLQEYLFSGDRENIIKLLAPVTKFTIEIYPVAKAVNNTRNNSPDLLNRYENEQNTVF